MKLGEQKKIQLLANTFYSTCNGQHLVETPAKPNVVIKALEPKLR